MGRQRMVRTVCECMKARRNKSRVGILVQLAVIGPLVVSLGCASPSSQREADPLVAESDAKTDDEILYASILDVFAEHGLDLHLQDDSRGMVLTTWTEVNREVRHRWVARAIRSNVGLVLTVDSRYERRDGTGAEVRWIEADDRYTLDEKERDEQRMGTAIMKRFKALGGGRK